MADLTLRLVKGSPLTNAEVDANFSNLNEASIAAGEPMGHANRADSVLTFTAATRTVTIAPTGAQFVVWCKSKKYTFTSAQSVVIPNTTELHYIYFNTTGVLSVRQTFFDWENDTPTAYVAWNATTQTAPFFADERHGITLDWQTHEYLHRTRGAALANGFSLSNYSIVGTGSLDADAQLDLSGGTFFDEDLQVDVEPSNTPTPNTWEQDLTGPAQIPVLYRSGTGWIRDAPTNFVLKAGTATPRYNTESAGVWGLTDVPNNSYSVVWVIATNNLTYPVLAIMGQIADNNAGTVENADWSSLNLGGFPAIEFRPLYKVIFQSSSGYANSIKARFTNVFDIRNLISASPAATIGSSHGGLSGLGNDDHLQYVHVSEIRTISAGVKASFLPVQTGNGGKYLQTDGTVTSWATLTNPNNGTLTLSTSGSGISGSASFSADQATNSAFTVTINSSTTNVVNTLVFRDASGNFSANAITANSFSGPLSGNASTATTLATARTISATGDIAWTTTFNGSTNVTGAATLAASGVTAAVYGSATQAPVITVDAKGRITLASASTITPAFSSITARPTTLSGYGITDAQALDADLTAIGALTGTSGFLKKDAANTWSLDTNTYLTGITSLQVTTALGFTPYNATNPNGYITSSGIAANVSGTVAIANGGTGATTAAAARTNLGATTVGGNVFTLANPSAITFPRFNADNTVSALDAATFRTAIGAGTSSTTGTVTSVATAGTVSGITLTGGPITSTGTVTLGGTLAVTPSNFASQTANTVLAAPTGVAGVPTFRALVAADVPTLNQNTTGTASNVTGTVAVANGGTGATTAAAARTNLGATTLGSNLFTLTNVAAISFPRFNADNTVSSLDAATFRTAIGAGTSSTTGTVTSVGGTGTVSGLTLTGTVTTTGNLTLGGTLAVTPSNFASQTANTFLAAPTGVAGVPTFRAVVAADIPTLNQNTTGTAANVTGVVAAVNGGTGQSSYAVGDLLYASTTTALSKLADVATGNALISGGVGVAPSYGKIGLTTHVSGTLPVLNGGTGVTTSTGTGNTVLSASPTFTGTITASAYTGDGAFTLSNVATNISLGASQTTGTWVGGGTAQTGAITLGQSTAAQTLNIATGATATATTKTVNIGTGGLSGSTTNINIGSSVATSTTTNTVYGPLRLAGTTSGYVGLRGATAAGATTYTLPAADGTSGQVLSTNGTATLSWATASSQVAGGVVLENGQTITANYTMTAGKNGLCAGPITINSGVTVTIPTGSVWAIV